MWLEVWVLGPNSFPAAQPPLSPVFFLTSYLQALGSFYFLHESLKNIYQFDFKGKSCPPGFAGAHRCQLSGPQRSIKFCLTAAPSGSGKVLCHRGC